MCSANAEEPSQIAWTIVITNIYKEAKFPKSHFHDELAGTDNVQGITDRQSANVASGDITSRRKRSVGIRSS